MKKQSQVLIYTLLTVVAVASASSKYDCLREAIGLGREDNGIKRGAQGAYDLRQVLSQYEVLPKEITDKIATCDLDLSKAKDRCEASYGEDNCEKISPTAYQTKCESYFERRGCCHCTMKCPKNFKNDEYHCLKPDGFTSESFSSLESCKQKHSEGCEMRGDKYY